VLISFYFALVEITLSHSDDFIINVTESGFIAKAHTTGNTTKVVIINNETNPKIHLSNFYLCR